MRETERQGRRRTIPRVSRHVIVWGSIGGVVGAILGILVGLAFTTPGRFGFWMAIVAASIFLGAVCAFTAGIASLEAPPAGKEPSDATAPPEET